MRLLESRRQLDLAAKAFDVDAGTELGRQDFDDDVATERHFADDEDARHSTAQVVSDLVAVAERALKALGQISNRFLIQVSSALGKESLQGVDLISDCGREFATSTATP